MQVYVKIKNFFPTPKGGTADYKGLDREYITPGTQFLIEQENSYVFEYNSEVPNHPDIEIIDEEVYNAIKEEQLTNRPKHPVELMQEQIDALTLEILQLKGLV